MLLLAPAIAACLPRATVGSLGPTLRFLDTTGGRVPEENGIVVPTFEQQPRPRIDLDGRWRVETTTLDDDLSLTDRSQSLPAIEDEAAGRQTGAFDDAGWPLVSVPGTIDPPPKGAVRGAWYRRHVTVPSEWADRSITLKFESANYVADVWVNGQWLGVHEGGNLPFAFDATAALEPGGDNVVAVRVDDPQLGTRVDTVPWGLVDWWDYAGITGGAWLEASAPVRAARADVVPHLDGADVSVAVENRGTTASAPTVRVDVFPARITAAALLDPDPATLLPPLATAPTNPRLPPGETSGGPSTSGGRAAPGTTTRVAVASAVATPPTIAPGGAGVVTASLLIPSPSLWAPGTPNLYVAQVTVDSENGRTDTLYETFGLRRVAVDPDAPRVLINGRATMLTGVAVHDEVLAPGGTTGAPLSGEADALAQLRRALAVNANFVRTGHEPADPALLRLADRLGIAVWEEIPLYHFTPLTFQTARERGVAAQMLEEMDLRDMNRPSVLFHGLSNESTGGDERTAALGALRDVDRAVDGTRLLGQAAYGFDAADGTSEPLDVVGITSYFGVFYGTDPEGDTAAALDAAHARYPGKPLMVLEFGHWADTSFDEAQQSWIFTQTTSAIDARRETLSGGFVASLVWWTLDDYLTSRPGLSIERFGLFAPDGTKRPVASLLAERYGSIDATTPSARRAPTDSPSLVPSAGAAPAVLMFGLAAAVGIGGGLLVLAILAFRGQRRSTAARAAVRIGRPPRVGGPPPRRPRGVAG